MSELEQQLTAITESEPSVLALVRRHPDDHLTTEVARSLSDGGQLAGWTLGVKDVIDTIDLPTERGSAIYPGRHTVDDAACVALARSAGATVLGKTTSTEFALFTPTATTNPHDQTRTPGGSSSGSAAAVAAGMVRVAFGTQTVGSVIRPAAFCGVVGFKPTHQLVPLDGVATLAQSLDTLGWFTNSVADTIAMHRVLAGPGSAPTAPITRRLGLYRSAQWDRAQPETEGVLVRAADSLGNAGFAIEDVPPLDHLDGVFDAAHIVLQFEMARVFHWERTHHWEKISPLVQKMLNKSDGVTAADYAKAQRTLQRARIDHDQWLVDNQFDGMLTPSAPGVAPTMETTGDSAFNRTWSALGTPAIHLPTERSETLGLPIGIQLTGRRWADDNLLTLASEAETTFNTKVGVAR